MSTINPKVQERIKRGSSASEVVERIVQQIKKEKILKKRVSNVSKAPYLLTKRQREISEDIQGSGLFSLVDDAINYYPYSKLLTSPDGSTKIKKSLTFDAVATWILYLAPSKLNSFGKNICGSASRGCVDGCLTESGRGGFESIQATRQSKTNFFFASQEEFLANLYKDIVSATKSNATLGIADQKFKLDSSTLRAMRLNGTSDLPWEVYFSKRFPDRKDFQLTKDNPYGFMSTLPQVMFYDYTKHVKRANQWLDNKDSGLAGNYHLTLSRSESNESDCIDFIKRGGTSAIVFMLDYDDDLPSTYRGIPVVDGDESDARFLDPQGVWIGLRWKVNKMNQAKNLDPYQFSVRKDMESPIDWYPEDGLPENFANNVS